MGFYSDATNTTIRLSKEILPLLIRFEKRSNVWNRKIADFFFFLKTRKWIYSACLFLATIFN